MNSEKLGAFFAMCLDARLFDDVCSSLKMSTIMRCAHIDALDMYWILDQG